MPPERLAAAPVLAAAFRPFFLLGVAYAIVLIALAGAGYAGLAPELFPMRWHAHEMIHGFAVAIIVGVVLSALPSWAGTDETEGARLALLALAWLLGRLACLLAPWLPWGWVAAADLVLPLALLLHLGGPLLRLAQRRWRAVLVVFTLFALANLGWHRALAVGDAELIARTTRAALWVVVLMYALAGGLFTPVFTGNVLAQRALAPPRPPSLALEWSSALAVAALGVADVSGAAGWLPALSVAALALQGWRWARWRGWHALHDPLVAGMHLGFGWLLLALLLKALDHLGMHWPEAIWVHAFTIGALGSMMLALMTRVVLRHTGRPLVAPRRLPWLLALISLAALLRMLAPLLGVAALAAAALLWALAFGGWLALYAPLMWRASLPRRPAPGGDAKSTTQPKP